VQKNKDPKKFRVIRLPRWAGFLFRVFNRGEIPAKQMSKQSFFHSHNVSPGCTGGKIVTQNLPFFDYIRINLLASVKKTLTANKIYD